MVAPYTTDEVRNPFVTTAPSSLDVFDRPAGRTSGSRFGKVVTTPSSELTAEVDGAADWLGVRIEEILLAALGRAFGRTRGDGAVAVDVLGGHRWLGRHISLHCAASWPMGPTELLQGAHTALASSSGTVDSRSDVLVNIDSAPEVAAVSAPALELRVERIAGLLHIEWRYDVSRLDSYSVEELAEQFPLALIEITSDAGVPL